LPYRLKVPRRFELAPKGYLMFAVCKNPALNLAAMMH
jgi:hypothetical protein